ncbi:glycosyltransferase family 2 protein [Desulfosporosinus sp. OT]|uniref:glycosyltransferase family 2 protein n=1 Tax=Desulfosporosinus sp. OT TaxID=913865 RepID=UPI000223A4AB|nr:glycosyltransferase family 2 protein [Desulfosporosinus sp. OT]EGW37864.1 glycosyl transferase 2 family protein [Desulfosporosinus sp. OT]
MISVIMPVYNEGNQIYSNVVKVISILARNKTEHQIVLVNDGSSDNSWSEMQRLSRDYANVLIIKLSRNFGKEAAICAGLENSLGDACLILDSDLQHPPEMIPEMIRLWRDECYDVVEGVKSHRGKESLAGKFAALTFYKFFRKTTGINLNSASDFKLLDRKVVDSWKQMNESITFFRGMSAWLGFNRIQVPFNVQERVNGTTKWSKANLIKLAIHSITSFSALPLHLVTCLGTVLLIVDVVLVTQTMFMKYTGKASTGFTTVIILILGVGSLIMISLGIIGVYLSKIYDEVKHRPRYLISTMLGKELNDE